MSEQPKSNNPDMVDVTDSLEAMSVFRAWKGFFLFVLVLCMLLIQGVFWVTDLGLITQEQADPNGAQLVQLPVSEPNVAGVSDSGEGKTLYGVTSVHLDRALGIINTATFLAAVLFFLTLMFSMMITIMSRLGGIRHISRAFFLSMIMLVLLVPWYAILEWSVLGVLFGFEDLMQSMAGKQASLYTTILYYARFCGYWAVTILLLLMAQVRLGRWSRAMIRRLEIL